MVRLRLTVAGFILFTSATLLPRLSRGEPEQPPAEAKQTLNTPATIPTPAEVRDAFAPLAKTISQAKTLRVTVKSTVLSAVGAEVVGKNQGLFQIASKSPNLLALSAKFDADAIRFASDGVNLKIQLSPTAYVEVAPPESFAALVNAMPIQLGPQPEPMLWLSIAGLDPTAALLSGLSEAQVIPTPAASTTSQPEVPLTTIRASRPEGVQWELRIASGDKPRPVSLDIDITEMITRANNLQLPEGYSFKILYEFERWEVDTEIKNELFQYTPPQDAERFESIAEFLLKKNNTAPHPLLGKPAPVFTTKNIAGEEAKVEYSGDEVVVLDFWATWCAPCVESLPEMESLAKKFKDRPVRFYAVNVSEELPAIESFLKDRDIDLPVLLDPQGEIAGAFAASAIPLTILIGKGGRVEAVHVGFDPNESTDILAGELETLLAGRRIHEAEEVEQNNDQDSEVQDSEVQDSEVQDSEVQDSEVQDSEVQDSEVQDTQRTDP